MALLSRPSILEVVPVTAFTKATTLLLHLTAERLLSPRSWKSKELQRELEQMLQEDLTGPQKHHLMFLEELLRIHLNVYGAREELQDDSLAITRELDSDGVTLWNRTGNSLPIKRDDLKVLRDMLNDMLSSLPGAHR